MRRMLIAVTMLAGTAAFGTGARAATVFVPVPLAGAPVEMVQYAPHPDWRAREEWRHRREVEWRRHQQWARWHHEHERGW